MTTTSHQPSYRGALGERQARVGKATQAFHGLNLALASNCGLLDTPAGQASMGWTETGGDYSFSYVRNPGCRFVAVVARVCPTATPIAATVALDLTVRDAAGHAVTSSDDRIPRQWRGEVIYAPSLPTGGAVPEWSHRVVGYLDCDALDDTLTDPSWSFDLSVALSGGAELDGVWLCEMPRFLVDDSVAGGGVLPGAFQRDAVISDDPTAGLDRLVATQASARQQQRSYLALTWRKSTSPSETPSLSSTADGPFTLLTSGAGARTVFSIVPRSIAAASAAGEPVKVRFLYRFDGGGGAETVKLRLRGLATGSPWTTTDLPYTTVWTWSAWLDAAVRTSPLSDQLSLSGQLSASGPTLWLAGVHVREAVT